MGWTLRPIETRSEGPRARVGFLGGGSESPLPSSRGSGEPRKIWIFEHFRTSEITSESGGQQVPPCRTAPGWDCYCVTAWWSHSSSPTCLLTRRPSSRRPVRLTKPRLWRRCCSRRTDHYRLKTHSSKSPIMTLLVTALFSNICLLCDSCTLSAKTPPFFWDTISDSVFHCSLIYVYSVTVAFSTKTRLFFRDT